jgi:hypothetical protein
MDGDGAGLAHYLVPSSSGQRAARAFRSRVARGPQNPALVRGAAPATEGAGRHAGLSLRRTWGPARATAAQVRFLVLFCVAHQGLAPGTRRAHAAEKLGPAAHRAPRPPPPHTKNSRGLACQAPSAPARAGRTAGRPLTVAVAAVSCSSAEGGRGRARAARAAATAAPPSLSSSPASSSATAWAPPPPSSPRGGGGGSSSSSSTTTSPWLAAAIKEAVRGIDDAPFLLLSASGQKKQFLRHRVSPSVVAAPSLWPGIAAVVAEAAGGSACPPGSIMLVHPLAEGGLARVPGGDEEEDESGSAPRSVRPRPLAGVTDLPPAAAAWGPPSPQHHHHHHHLRLADTSRLVDAGLAVAEVAGRVGDACCDEAEAQAAEAEDAAAAALPAALNARAAAPLAFDHPPHAPSGGEPGVAYYGVVVLSGDQQQQQQQAPKTRSNSGGGGGGDAGCYVLKTVRAPAAGGCSCVYFSLTRVFRGEPLAAQLVTSWLA